MIYKTFFGKYIDLSKLASVSDVKKVSIQGSTLASFEILISGCAPFACNREMTYEEYKSQETISAVIAEVQSQVDEIIKAWEEYKKNSSPEVALSRNELAARAMQGFCSREFPEGMKESWVEWASSLSLELADEMIKQGEKP